MNKYFSVSFLSLLNSSQCLPIEYTLFFQIFLFFYMSFRLVACYPSDLLVGITTVDPHWSKAGVYAYSFGQLSGVHWLLCSEQSNPVKYVKSLTWAWAFWLNNLDWSPAYSPSPSQCHTAFCSAIVKWYSLFLQQSLSAIIHYEKKGYCGQSLLTFEVLPFALSGIAELMKSKNRTQKWFHYPRLGNLGFGRITTWDR